eukprot:s1836_g2.t2
MLMSAADTTAADGLLVAFDQGGLWREALASITERQRSGPRPGLHAFGAAIGACSKGLEWQQGVQLFRKMTQLKLRPDVWIWSATTSACEKGHAWHLALHCLRDLRRRGLKPDAVVYNASISACEKGMQWRRAIALFSEMSLCSVRPDVVTYNSTVSACEKNFRWIEALQLVDQLERSREGLAASPVTYNALLAALAGSAVWALSLHVVHRRLPEQGLSVAPAGQCATLLALARARRWSQAASLLADSLAPGMPLSTKVGRVRAAGVSPGAAAPPPASSPWTVCVQLYQQQAAKKARYRRLCRSWQHGAWRAAVWKVSARPAVIGGGQ